MVMPNLPLPPAEQVTANQNPHLAELATGNPHLLPVAQVMVMQNLKLQPAVLHAGRTKSNYHQVKPGSVETL
jgi:hypothetical protein